MVMNRELMVASILDVADQTKQYKPIFKNPTATMRSISIAMLLLCTGYFATLDKQVISHNTHTTQEYYVNDSTMIYNFAYLY